MTTLHTLSLARLALPSGAFDADGTVNGATIDLSLFKNNFRNVLFVATAAAVTDGTHAFGMQHSDNGVDWTAVPTTRVQGALPTFGSGDDHSVQQVGYIVQTQRYVRLTVTTDDSTDGGVLSAVVLLAGGATTPPARS